MNQRTAKLLRRWGRKTLPILPADEVGYAAHRQSRLARGVAMSERADLLNTKMPHFARGAVCGVMRRDAGDVLRFIRHGTARINGVITKMKVAGVTLDTDKPVIDSLRRDMGLPAS